MHYRLYRKLIDAKRIVSSGSYQAVKRHYDNDYVSFIKSFNQRTQYQRELRKMVDSLKIEAESHLLDFGCNDGYAAALVRDWTGCEIKGVDQNPIAIEKGRRRYPDIDFELIDGDHLPFDNSTFDCCMINHVIGHVQSPVRVLSEINRVLKPEGRVGIVTPNKYYKIGVLPYNVVNDYEPDPTVLRYFSMGELSDCLQRANFKIDEIRTIGEQVPWLKFLNSHKFRLRVFAIGRKVRHK
jgi:ubiquinone/menaquinone biosynthesis C-methylase UbiE